MYTIGESPIQADPFGNRFLSGLDIPGRRVSKAYVAGLLTLGFFAGLVYLLNEGRYERPPILMMTLCVIGVVVLWVLRKALAPAPRNWLSPDTIFVGMFAIFHFSYVAFYAFRLVEYDSEVFWDPKLILRAVFFCLLCLIFFCIGYELTGGAFRTPEMFPVLRSPPHAAGVFGRLMVWMAVLFFWGMLFSVGIGRLIHDYGLLKDIGYLPGGRFFWVALNICAVGLAVYCAYSGVGFGKALKGPLFALIAASLIGGVLLLGDRGGFVYLAIIPVLGFYYCQKKIRLKWIALFAVALLTVFNIIAVTRDMVVLDVKEVADVYSASRAQEHSIFVRSAMEFGSSIKTVVIAMDLVPSLHEYWKGTSYMESLQYAVPNVIPGYVRVGQSVGVWLNEMAFGSMRETHGRGGSIAMEAYMNFGFYLGAMSFFLLGLGYRWFYERFLRRPSFFNLALLLGLTSALTMWIRNTSTVYWRTAVWTLLVAGILHLVFAGRHQEDMDYNEYSTTDLPLDDQGHMANRI